MHFNFYFFSNEHKYNVSSKGNPFIKTDINLNLDHY